MGSLCYKRRARRRGCPSRYSALGADLFSTSRDDPEGLGSPVRTGGYDDRRIGWRRSAKVVLRRPLVMAYFCAHIPHERKLDPGFDFRKRFGAAASRRRDAVHRSRRRCGMSAQREMPPEPEHYLNRQRLAAILGMSVKTVDRWVLEGMPSETWGLRNRRFLYSEVRAWLACREPRREGDVR